MKISLVINCDTRPQNDTFSGQNLGGVVNEDFLTDGVFNKINFFKGFDIEPIVFVDEHMPVSDTSLSYLRSIADTVVVRTHTHEHGFNDWNYHNALSLARGEYVCHMDQDTACFTSSTEPINQMINWLQDYKFVSYPSHWSPNAVNDPSFGGRTWASTRFFMCKRETLQLDNLRLCIQNPEWAYEKYGNSPRRCNWTEHFLTLMNNDSCYYPPIELDKYCIFSWGSYEKYTLRRLNEYSYDQIKEWLNSHPIVYPNDIHT